MIIQYLNDYFKKNEITQREIENRTGITQYKLSLVLNGKRRLIADELVTIAVQFEIDLNKIKEIIQSPNLK